MANLGAVRAQARRVLGKQPPGVVIGVESCEKPWSDDGHSIARPFCRVYTTNNRGVSKALVIFAEGNSSEEACRMALAALAVASRRA